MAAALGENPAKALDSLEATTGQRPQDLELKYAAARALAMVSKALVAHDPVEGRKLAARRIQQLKEVIPHPDADLAESTTSGPRLAPRRSGVPGYDAGRSLRPPIAAVWTRDSGYESEVRVGLDPVAQLQYARDLIGQNYRPVAWSVARMATDSSLVTASVWRRPLVSESMKDELAERQARGSRPGPAGKGEIVWPLLVNDADPRVRSFIINWLRPMGAEPASIALEFNRSR